MHTHISNSLIPTPMIQYSESSDIQMLNKGATLGNRQSDKKFSNGGSGSKFTKKINDIYIYTHLHKLFQNFFIYPLKALYQVCDFVGILANNCVKLFLNHVWLLLLPYGTPT